MLAKIKKVRLQPEYKNPTYTAVLECPEGNELYVKFDYTYVRKSFMPLNVYYNRKNKGAKLSWYTNKVEHMKVQDFLAAIAEKINKQYNFKLKEK